MTQDVFDLTDRVAIVTGASSGLGVAFAQALAEAGADVVLAARRVDRLADTAALVEAAGRRALCGESVLADPDARQAPVDAAMLALRLLDGLVNNGGVGTGLPGT